MISERMKEREREGAWETGKEKKEKSRNIKVWCKHRTMGKKMYRIAALL